jgi:predicted  nucleic acid-binding Zn-ribbon protein
MTQQRRTALKELQGLDTRIEEARAKIREFDARFEEVEEPALRLEGEVTTTRGRVQEMKLEERRLELSTEEKRTRVQRLDERLGSVRNLREEAAVSTELDMVKRALQSDEQEAFTMLDQIRKLDERLEELEAAYAEAKGLLAPQVDELVKERDAAKEALANLEVEREQFVGSMDPTELRLYNGIRAGGRRLAVSELTDDGACGHCFGVIPLQLQNEIRHGTALIRCEACGVILAAQSPESAAEVAAAEEAARADEASPAEEEEPAAEADAPIDAGPPAEDAEVVPVEAEPEA